MNKNDELKHYGVLGMKWGVRRYQPYKNGKYRASGGVRAAMARRANKKTDKKFQQWKESDRRRDDAIAKGKKATESKIAYQNSPKDKELKKQYKSDNKAYKKALKKNTIYRKGVVKRDVGQDRSRKLLSDAKRLEKALNAKPNDKNLRKQYKKTLSEYHIERDKARRALPAAEARSNRVANLRRQRTMLVKSAATTAAVGVGIAVVNNKLGDGMSAPLNSDSVRDGIKKGRQILRYAGYR